MLGTGPSYPTPGTPLLGHLMYSAPPKSRAASAGATALSLLFHALLLTVAVLLVTGRRPQAAVAPPGFDIVLPTEAPPEPPPPPPTPATPTPPTADPQLFGFKELTTPPVVPVDIPPVTAGPPINEFDYNGIGVRGGTGTGSHSATGSAAADVVESPGAFVPFTVSPSLKNVEAVQRALVRAYPAMLRDAGVTGRVLVWVLVDEQGQVMKAVIKQTSGVAPLDEAALSVARTMEFSPGMNRDVKVKVWVALPIEFKVGH